jgi:hypothetical protein
MSALVECRVKPRVSHPMEEGKVEHCQARNRKHDTRNDETFSRARVRRVAFIGVHVNGGAVNRSTATGDADSPHIAREFCHPTQFLGEGELARGGSRFGPETFLLESVGKVGGEERDVDGCEKEYSIAAPKHVVFSGAVERIHRVTTEKEYEETGERKYPWKSTRGGIVNKEKRDMDENVECKRKSLRPSQVRSVCGEKHREE